MRKTGESKPPGTVAAAPGRSLRASRARAHRSGAIRRHRESLPPPPPTPIHLYWDVTEPLLWDRGGGA